MLPASSPGNPRETTTVTPGYQDHLAMLLGPRKNIALKVPSWQMAGPEGYRSSSDRGDLGSIDNCLALEREAA
jgi:hypothetical protein